MLQALIGAKIFDGDVVLEHCALVLEGDRVVNIVPEAQCPPEAARLMLKGGTLAPGFIDLQVNGGGGHLFSNNPTKDGLASIAAAHRQCGTTSILPTLISGPQGLRQQGIDAVLAALDVNTAGILGIHLEGPYFNRARRGVHKDEYIHAPTDEDIGWLIAQREKLSPAPVLITLAPERCSDGHINRLAEAGLHVCAGHTDADHEGIMMAIGQGLCGFTHLFNAMRPMQGRDPGVVGAALADKNTWCGIIADGHHVHPLSIQVALNAKPRGKIFLVSDAMATVGSAEKTFSLYGEAINEKNQRLVNSEERLAGSAIALIDAVRFCVEELGLALSEALRMASLYPAEFLHLDHQLGRFGQGYRADIVHFDEHFRVQSTWVAGEHQEHQHTSSKGRG